MDNSSRRERKPTEKFAQYSLKQKDEQSKRKESKEKPGKD